MSWSVRYSVHHVEALARRVDLRTDRLRRGDEAAGDRLGHRDPGRAGVGRRGEVAGEVGRERSAVAAEAGQEGRLRLAHHVAGDPDHRIVEAAVLEVVLDSRAARPRGRPVDHVELAVVGAADLVLAPVEHLVVGIQAVAVERELVVDDDLRARRGQAGEHRARLGVGPGSVAVDDHPDLNAVAPACAPTVPPDASPHRPRASRTSGCAPTTVRPRRPRRSAGRSRALGPRLDRRRRRPGELERRVIGRVPWSERLGRRLSTGRRHRVRGRRPARPLHDPEHLPVDEHERQRDHETRDRERLPDTARPAARASFAVHCRGSLHPTRGQARTGDRRDRDLPPVVERRAGATRRDGGTEQRVAGPDRRRARALLGPFHGPRLVDRRDLRFSAPGIVIGWTAIENWLDNRQVLDAGASFGLLIVVAASVVLIHRQRCRIRSQATTSSGTTTTESDHWPDVDKPTRSQRVRDAQPRTIPPARAPRCRMINPAPVQRGSAA